MNALWNAKNKIPFDYESFSLLEENECDNNQN